MVVDTKLFEVKNISFSYDDEEIFSDISFCINQGDVLCILGPNGTGKTTAIKCLNGLHEIRSGEILINGENMKKLSFREISRHIGYIPQSHVPSFPFKVFDVVLMGRAPYLNLTDSPKEEDVKIAEAALKTLGIENLKDKEYTNLSGGERQLVFLARVLCQKPDILILDEATSNLDAITERALDKTISEFSKDVTTIFIAHRLSTIKNCDKIYVLEDGKIIESGNHTELVAKGGKYAQLVKQQSLDTVDVKATA